MNNNLKPENIYSKEIVLKNALWLYLGFGLNKLLKILIIVISARILGPEKYGIFTYAFSVLGLFFLISDWGISALLIRDYQQSSDRENIIKNSFTVKTFLTIFCSLLAIIGYFFLKNDNIKSVYLILLVVQIIINFRDFLNVIFKAMQKMEYESITISLESIIILLIVIVFLANVPTVFNLGLAYFLGIFISFLYILIVSTRYKITRNLRLVFNKEKLMYLIKSGIPLMLYGFLGFIFFSTDHLIIGYFRGMYELGLYSVATKIILNLNLIPNIAMTALLPYFAFQIFDRDKLYKIYKKIFWLIILISMILIIAINIVAEPVVKITLGSKYLLSIPILKLLIWVVLFLFPLILLDNIIFVFNKQWINFYLTLSAAFLNLILNFILVPIYGISGAIFATLISQFLNFLISYYIVEKIIFNVRLS